MFACSKDCTVIFRVSFLSLSSNIMWYPKISPFAKSLAKGFQANVRLVADVAAGVIFCGLPSGTKNKNES